MSTVGSLKRGRCEARETEPVRPVPIQYVEAIKPFLSRQLVAMVDVQALSGARGGELCSMRICDIDRSGFIWEFKPTQHKTAHHGHDRIIRFGKRAQTILAPLLMKTNLTAFVFSPADAERERREQQRTNRKTPLTPSQIERAELASKRRRNRPPGEQYDSRSYGRAIARACDQAFPPPASLTKGERESFRQWRSRLTPEQRRELLKWRADHRWHPHQLRHNFATNIRREFGADAALNLLGDKTTRMLDVYAEHDAAAATEIMRKIG